MKPSSIKRVLELVIGLPIGVAVLLLSPYIIRHLDPTAGVYDLGIVQGFIVGAAQVPAIAVLAYFGAALYEDDFPTQSIGRCDTKFLLFCLFFLGFTVLSASL